MHRERRPRAGERAAPADPVYSARVLDALVDRLAVAGDAATCTRRLREYDGLVDEAILLNVSAGDTVRERYGRAFGIRSP